MRARLLGSAVLLVLALVGCRKKKPPPVEAPPVAPERAEPPVALKMEQEGPRVGLPAGCTLTERPQSVPIPRGTIFFAPDEPRGELALLQPGPPRRIGIVSLLGKPSTGMLSSEKEHPSFFAATGAGWLQYATPTETPGQAWLTRESGAPELALQGEGLEAIDLRCRGDHCAAMSTRAMRVAAAGATVLLGRGASPLGAWRRSDYSPEGAEPERPFVVASVGEGRATGTTVSASGVRFFEANSDEAKPGVLLPTPYGALDALVLKRPVALAHGARLVGDCAKPRPLLAIQREGAPAVEIPVDAPPLSLFARPLDRGALVLWLVPTYCGDRQRRIAYAALLDEDGGVRSGPMAVTEATGIALATSGTRADVWLRRDERLVWLQMRCGEAR